MARSRNIKPGFFTNEDLVELDFATRLLFAGLWTVADKSGRLEDRPKKIKIAVFPADDVDIDSMLASLAERKFITRYTVDGAAYIQVTSWTKHQNPHHTEKASTYPECPNGELTVKAPLEPVESPKQDGGNPADSLIPDSGFTDSSVPNGTGGGAAKPIEKMTKDELWSAGKSILMQAGMPKDQCGSFVGKLVKDYGTDKAIEAVRAAVVARPADPAEYMKACCQKASGERKDQQQGRHYDSAEKTQQMLADQAKGTRSMPPEFRQVVAHLTGRKAA